MPPHWSPPRAQPLECSVGFVKFCCLWVCLGQARALSNLLRHRSAGLGGQAPGERWDWEPGAPLQSWGVHGTLTLCFQFSPLDEGGHREQRGCEQVSSDMGHETLDSRAISASKAVSTPPRRLCHDCQTEEAPRGSSGQVTRHAGCEAAGIRTPRQEGTAHSLVPGPVLKQQQLSGRAGAGAGHDPGPRAPLGQPSHWGEGCEGPGHPPLCPGSAPSGLPGPGPPCVPVARPPPSGAPGSQSRAG